MLGKWFAGGIVFMCVYIITEDCLHSILLEHAHGSVFMSVS